MSLQKTDVKEGRVGVEERPEKVKMPLASCTCNGHGGCDWRAQCAYHADVICPLACLSERTGGGQMEG